MYDLNNKLLKVFFSTAAANRYFHVKHSHICAVCNGKRHIALGYKWRFISKSYYNKLKNKYNGDYQIRKIYKKIDVFDLNSYYICTFSSVIEAEKLLCIKKSDI